MAAGLVGFTMSRIETQGWVCCFDLGISSNGEILSYKIPDFVLSFGLNR